MVEAVRKQEYQIQNVFGFDTKKLNDIKPNLTVRQALVLRRIISFYNAEGMKEYFDGTIRYIWINTGYFISTFEGLHYTKDQFRRDIEALVSRDLIKKVTINKNSVKRNYFTITHLTRSICVV